MLFGSNAQQKGNNQQFPNAGPRFPRANNFNNPNASGFQQQQQGQRPPRMMQQRNQSQGQNQQQFGGQNQGFNQQGNFNQNRQQRNSPLGFSVGNTGGGGQQFGNKFGNQGGAQNQGGFGNRGNTGMQQNQGGFGNRNAMQNQGGQGGPGGQGGFGNRGNMQQNQGGFGNRPNMGQRNFGGGQNQQQFGGQNQGGFNQQGNNPNQGRPQRSPIGFGTPATTAPIGFGSSQNTQSNQGQQGGQQFGNNRFNKTFQNAGGVTGFGQKPTNAQFRGNQGQNDQGGMGGQSGGFGGRNQQQQQQQDGGFQGRQQFPKQGGGPAGFQPKQFGLRRTPQGFQQRNQGNQSMSQDNTQMSTDRSQGRGGFQGQKQFGDRSHSDEGQGRPPYQRGPPFRQQQQGDMDGKMEREDGFGFGRGRGRGTRGRGERGSRFTVRGERGGRFGRGRGERGRGRGERGRGRGAGRGGRTGGGDRFDEENDREEDDRDHERGGDRDRDRDRGRDRDDEEEEEDDRDDRDDYSDEYDDEEPHSGEEDEYGDSQDDEEDESPRGRYDRDNRSSESPKKGGGPDLRNLITGGNKPSISDRIIKKSDQDAPPPPPKKEAPKLVIKPTTTTSQAKPTNEADIPKMTNKDRKRIVAKYGLDDRNANEVELERLYRQEIMQGTLEEPEPEKESPTHTAPRNRPVSLNQRFLTNIVKQTLTGREGDAAPPPPPQKKEPAPTTTTAAAAPVVSTPSMQISRRMSNQSKQVVQSLKDRLKQSQKASVRKPQVSLDEPDVYIPPEVIERFRAILDRGLVKEDEMVRGECMTMAPIEENRGTDMFERERGTETPRPEWFVKKYERAGADKNFNDPRQLRPLGVLRETMDYLVNNIIDVEKRKNARYALPKGRDKYRFDDIHNFIWGAFRSIKQDISIQRCSGERFAIELHEEIARYYLIAINEGKDPELRQFDSKLNIDQLTDTLTSLRLGYKEARNMAFKAYHLLKDQPGFNVQVMSRFEDKFYLSPNEAEFLAYDMIIQLESERNYLDILQRIMTFPNEVLVSKDVKFAIKVVTAVKENNYIEYFRLLGEADYLTSCVMSTLIKSIREKAIKAMSRSQARNNIETVSINKFYELLAFEDTQEAELFLRTYGLEEASQGMDIDDIQGSEGTSFRLQKVQIDGDEAKLEARKKFVALKPAMNIRIIETKRNIENFKSYQGDRDIHFDNTQVPRKFLVKGAWKHADPRHYLKVLKYMLNLNIEVPKQQERVPKQPQQVDEPGEDDDGQIEEIEDMKAEKQKTGLFSQPVDKTTSDLTIQRRMSSVPEPAKDLKKEKEKEDARLKAEQDAANKKKQEKEKEEEEKRRKIAAREAEKKRIEEERKKKQEKMAKFAAKLGEVLSVAVLETQKETFMYLESVVEYERELKAFRQGILQKPVKMGLTPQPLRYSGMVPDLAVMEEELEEEQHVFFRFLADSLAEHEPELERYCYKAVVFHPLFKDVHFELFRKMIEFLTDNQEKLEQIEFDQLPTLYENKNIEFEAEGEIKKLWVCFKVYDENYKAQDPKEKMNEENPKEGETGALIVPPADILGSNLIIFVMTGNKKLDKERFDPIYNAIMNKRHLENINILFLQAFEVKMDNTEKKLKKKDIIELFGLANLYEKGLQHHFIKLPYLFSTEMDNMKFVFKDIDYALKDKVTAVVKKGIEDQIYTNLPSFYTLRDLTEKLRNSLEELGDLKIDYESSEIEIKAKLLHEIMSSRSIESYFYVKNFLNHAVNSIKENFNYWYENLDRVAPEFLDNYNEKVVEKIKTARKEFLTILDKMFKINDFDDKYWRLLEYGSNARLNVNSIYSLLERKVEKIFRSRKREIRMDEVIGVLERNFKFGVIGVKGSWKLLFKTVYEYYMQFLDDLQPICILLDEDFKLDINIDALYADIENDLARYNEWITELEFQQYDAEEHIFEVTEAMEKTLLRKRPLEVFIASESSILPKDEDIIEDKEGISELDQINITTKKPLNSSSFLNNNPLPYLTLDWDFDKQFQTLKRIHIDDDMFTI